MSSIHSNATQVFPDDPRIQYSGRIDFSNPRKPRFDWSGVSIQIRFKGPSIGFLLEDVQNRFDVWVDGKSQTVLVSNPGQTFYPIEGLDPGEHRLQLTKRTEASWGVTTFLGLSLSDGVELLPAPPRLERKIEFIGDSWICGYGNEASSVHYDDLRPYENANQTFALVTSRELKAEAHLVCYSGRGLVRNYGDPQRQSAEPFPRLLDRRLCAEPQNLWDAASWIPDAVVIHLGTNDFSTEPHPDFRDFVESGAALLARLRSSYPQTSIFWFAPTDWPHCRQAVEAAVETRHRAGDARIHCVGYPPVPSNQMGCDYHPNAQVHQKLATRLTQALRQKLSW
ncbi:MAG: SGNH/GDSL hydrolase family protein [bacterium]